MEKFNKAQAKNLAAAQKLVDTYASSSEDEGDLDEQHILELLYKNYRPTESAGSSKDAARTSTFLENTLHSGAATCLICIGSIRRVKAAEQQNGQASQGHYNHLGEFVPPKRQKSLHWCCPQCRRDYQPAEKPTQYNCFCGKEANPQNQPFLVPHSCGEICGKLLQPKSPCKDLLACGKHKCNQECHRPGQCPPCTSKSMQPCECQRESKMVNCSDRKWKCQNTQCPCCGDQCPPCEKICGKQLSCNKHKCQSVCHNGPCYPCKLESQINCRCGKTRRSVPCGRERSARIVCLELCRITAKCHHAIKHRCHKGECQPCGQVCGLPNDTSKCGHICKARCHEAVRVNKPKEARPQAKKYEYKALPHPRCEEGVIVTCIGGHEVATWPCWNSKPSSCQRKCARQLKCGNHKCSLVCHSVQLPKDMSQQAGCANCEEGCSGCHPPPCAPCNFVIKSKCHCGLNQLVYKCSEYFDETGTVQEIIERREKLRSCGNRCLKNYPCGHRCTAICHSSKCPNPELCRKKVRIFCVCKRLKQEIACDKHRAAEQSRAQAAEQQHLEQKRRDEEERNRLELEKFEAKFGKRKHKERKTVDVGPAKSKINWQRTAIYAVSILTVVFAIVVAFYADTASSEFVASAGERTQSAVTSSTSTWVKSQASTSRKAGSTVAESPATGSPGAGGEAFVSMSTLREDVEDHGFAVVLDDESSTFEISSSNSLPTSAGAASTMGVVAAEDSSSTDTLNGGHPLGHPASSEHSRQGFFNEDNEDPPVDDPEPEDEDEEELIEDDDEDVVNIGVAAIDCLNTSQLALADGTIMAADGSKIFLETPVVIITGSQSELTGKPKRLSDEFLLGDEEQAENLALVRGIKSEPGTAVDDHPFEGDDAATCSSLHDRLMSMSLTANAAVSNPSPAASANAAAPEEASTSNSSSNSSSSLTKADIESMDLIERRDFETEQRLTGDIILRTSSMMSQNKLNLSSRVSNGSGTANSDDWPSSSSNGRTVSSDSKYTYKDLSTTPTSSRKYTNSRLSKSTAKLNLGSTLGVSSCSQHRSSSKSSTSCTGAARTDVYTNTNSNDYPGLAPTTSGSGSTSSGSCQEPDENVTASVSYSSTSQEGGCSRTTALNPTAACSAGAACLGDSQASTSASTSTSSASVGAGASNSNRCQYATASTTKTTRQERFLARSNPPAASGAGAAQPAASVRQRRNGSSDVAHLEVLVEEGAAGGDGGGLVEPGDFSAEEPWANCDEENNCSDLEEICTNASLSETFDLDVMDPMDEPISLSLSTAASATGFAECSLTNPSSLISQQRKRKYNEGRLLDGGDYSLTISSSGGVCGPGSGRIAYDFASTPRSSQHSGVPTAVLSLTPSSHLANASPGSGLGRRTPRSVPTRDNPPPELQHWLAQFQRWSHVERLLAVRHMMKVIEPQFQRDFISLLPRELALFVLSYLEPKDLLRAAQTCRSWRFLCDDNLLWKEKCRKAQILAEPRSDRRDGNMPPIASPWKAAYMRQHIIEMNWRSRPVRKPKVLKGHDDHVITCLQFSGNRIVSGSDDNTLKVWSAVNGKCLRTLVGHTGGVWSSQMSGNIIISGSTDRTLKVWDMDSGACVHTLQGHTSTVRCMHLHGSKVVSGSRDATLRVWDIEQGSCLHVLVGHLAAVRCVQYDGKLIVSGAYDYMVKIWHPERQECLHTLQGHTNRVYSLQFDGLHVVSGSLDTSIRVWDVETGNCKHTLMGHQSLTSGMELRQNILVSGNADSTVKVWDITTGQCLQTLSGPNKHQSAVTCLQFNSRFVVTSSDDGTVKLWDVKTGDFIRNLVALDSGGSGGVVWRIRANDTKLICAVGSRNGTEETKLMVLDFDVEGACVKCS
ncbi:hypothetical protein M5D96_008093 [Drosophila gunungcola]|uniref:F-box domain-containing protein n=1 Tax=Drosophila gunungcola TaxID=103775 RepID=A0A9P9YLS4_9MUSC|nr:hypothetical protein M5D96_008093 [Drosophila gunungcola]